MSGAGSERGDTLRINGFSGEYHLPWALLVTRLYLLGSGIDVMRVSAEVRPKGWWWDRQLWREIPRMWGTALRVALAVVGIENWPRPAGMLLCQP